MKRVLLGTWLGCRGSLRSRGRCRSRCGSNLGGRCRSRSSLRCGRRCRSRRGSYHRSGSGLRAGSSTLVLRAGAGNRLGTSTRGGLGAATGRGLRTATRSRLGAATGSRLRTAAGSRLRTAAGSRLRAAAGARLRAAAGSGLRTATRSSFRTAAGSGGGVVRVLGLDDLADHLHDLLSLLGVAVALLQLDGDLLHVLLHRALFGPGARAVADHDASSLDDNGSRSRRGRGCCGGILSHGEGRQGCQHGDECLLHMRV